MATVVSRGVFDILTQINWDVFGTLTFKGPKPVPVQFHNLWRFMRQVSWIVSRPYRELLIAVRHERGEIGGRQHFHFLLGGTEAPNKLTLCFQLEHRWRMQTGAQQVRIRPYSPCGCAGEYLTKSCDWSWQGANAYEMAIFDQADSVSLSRSITRCLRVSNCITKRRHFAAHKQADQVAIPGSRND